MRRSGATSEMGDDQSVCPEEDEASDEEGEEGNAEMRLFQRKLMSKFADQGDQRLLYSTSLDDVLTDSPSEDDEDDEMADESSRAKKKSVAKGKAKVVAPRVKRKPRKSKSVMLDEGELDPETVAAAIAAGVPLDEGAVMKKPRKPRTSGTGAKRKRPAKIEGGDEMSPAKRKRSEGAPKRILKKKGGGVEIPADVSRAPILMPEAPLLFQEEMVIENADHVDHVEGEEVASEMYTTDYLNGSELLLSANDVMNSSFVDSSSSIMLPSESILSSDVNNVEMPQIMDEDPILHHDVPIDAQLNYQTNI